MWRTTISVAAGLLLVAACGSSSNEPLAVEMLGSMGDPANLAELSGPAVDDGVVCEAATTEIIGYQDLDGNSLTEDEYNESNERSMETGELTVGGIDIEYTCDDGSGTFVMQQQPTVVASEFDFESFNEDIGTWVVDRGTDDYEGLSGEGSIDFDFANGQWMCTGELTG